MIVESNGMASIHPGPLQGVIVLTVAGMTWRPRGPVAGSTSRSASSRGGAQEVLKPAYIYINIILAGLPGVGPIKSQTRLINQSPSDPGIVCHQVLAPHTTPGRTLLD